MKILIIPVVIPYPLDNGGAVAQYAVLEYLQDKCDITLCCKVNSSEDFIRISELTKRLGKIKVEIIDLRSDALPIINIPVKSSVLRTIIRFIRRKFLWVKRFGAAPQAIAEPIIQDKSDEFEDNYRINPVVIENSDYIYKLSDILKSSRWDIIQTEFYEMSGLVELFPVESKKVFISHESRTLRLESAKVVSVHREIYCDYIISLNRQYEIEILKKYDKVITFSKDDLNRLSQLGVSNLAVSAFPVLNSDFNDISLFQTLNKLVFIGGSAHYPNREGFNWFVENIYPAIHETYRLPLVVIGKWSEEHKIQKYIGEIHYKGFVDDIDTELKNAIQIVPVRIGNGIRTKILTGMAKKMPIITSSLGVEGIELSDYTDILIADSQDEFLKKIDFVIQNPLAIQNIIENASTFVRINYSQTQVGETRLKIYKELLDD